MRTLPLIDFQHNRAMLHNIDNNFDSLFSSNVPPLLCFGTTRRNSLHCIYDLFYHNERSSFDCMSLIFWMISFAKLLHFQHWYIIILWFYCIIHLLKHLIITVSHFCQHVSSCWFWTHFVSPRSRFLFLLQITISAQQRMVHSFICCQVFIFTRSFALFSGMCAEAPPFRLLHH